MQLTDASDRVTMHEVKAIHEVVGGSRRDARSILGYVSAPVLSPKERVTQTFDGTTPAYHYRRNRPVCINLDSLSLYTKFPKP